MIQISHDFDAVGFYSMNNDTVHEGVSVIRRNRCEQKKKEEIAKDEGVLCALFGGRRFMFCFDWSFYAGCKSIPII